MLRLGINVDDDALERSKHDIDSHQFDAQILEDVRGIPLKRIFFSKLTGAHISDSDYKHARRMWDAFDIESLSEY